MTDLQRYLEDAVLPEKIHGWVEGEVHWEILRLFTDMQRDLGVTGGGCEIGVFKGLYFLGIANAVDRDSTSVAIDLFQENYSTADKGYRHEFDRNVQDYLASGRSIEVITGDSTKLSEGDLDILEKAGPFQFFSIDGGHDAATVQNDLAIAEKYTDEMGVISIDDISALAFPGVFEGVTRYYACTDEPRRFRPFALSRTKLYMTTTKGLEAYIHILRASLAEKFPTRKLGRTVLFDLPCLTVDETEHKPA